MFAKFRSMINTHSVEISWALVVILAISSASELSGGNYLWGSVLAGLAVLNYLLRNKSF